MESHVLELWKFSSEATQKKAEELVKAFLEFDGDQAQTDPLLEAVFEEALKSADKVKPQYETDGNLNNVEPEFGEYFECEAWVDIDDLSINDEIDEVERENDDHDEKSIPSDGDIFEDNENTMDSASPKSEPKNEVENISYSGGQETVNELLKELDDVGKACLSVEGAAKLGTLSEIYFTDLLHSASDNALESLCKTICERMGSREQSVYASLICSKLLVKIQTSGLQASCHLTVKNLAFVLPHVITLHLLMPLLREKDGRGHTITLQIIGACDSEELRLDLLRSWLNEQKEVQLTKLDLSILKELLKTPVRDANSLRRLCVLFQQTASTHASDLEFSKFLLSFIKSIPQGSIGAESKRQLGEAVTANKSSVKRLLEKALSNI